MSGTGTNVNNVNNVNSIKYTKKSIYHLIGWFIDHHLKDDDLALHLYELQMACYPDDVSTKMSIFNAAHILRFTDKPRAIELFKSICDKDVDAIFMLGVVHQFSDWEESKKWYTLGAERGDGGCLNKLGEIYLRGSQGIPKDEYKAYEYFIKSSEKNCFKSYENISKFYKKGLAGKPIDSFTEMKWIQKIPKNKLSPTLKFNLGHHYLEECFKSEDKQKGIQIMEELVNDKDDYDAMFMLGKSYMRGWGNYERDENKGLEWYKKAAAAGDYVACIELLKFTTGSEHSMYFNRAMEIRNTSRWEYRNYEEFPLNAKISVEVETLLELSKNLQDAKKEIEEYELRPPIIGGKLFNKARERFGLSILQ